MVSGRFTYQALWDLAPSAIAMMGCFSLAFSSFYIRREVDIVHDWRERRHMMDQMDKKLLQRDLLVRYNKGSEYLWAKSANEELDRSAVLYKWITNL